MRDGYHPLFLREEDDADNYKANEDYSSATKRFVLAPSGKRVYLVNRLIITIHDSDSDYNKFGDLVALTNGLRLVIENSETGEEYVDILGGIAVKCTADFMSAGFEVQPLNSGSSTKVTQLVKEFKKPLILRGEDNDQLVALYHDDLTGLDENNILAELEKRSFF